MIENWPSSFKRVIESEGGYVNDATDRGGETNLGVTRVAWGEYLGRPVRDGEMRGLTVKAVEPFYKERYWDACRCGELPSGVDYLVFDLAVNAGPGRAIRMLQQSVGAKEDGELGPRTMAAVARANPAGLLDRFTDAKEAFYMEIVRRNPSQQKFINGWLARVDKVHAVAATMLA